MVETAVTADASDSTAMSGDPESGEDGVFQVHVTGFDGPFELLLSLIAGKKLEVTALAFHQVTDNFVQHVRAQGDTWDLDETTEFLVIAAILLDLKAARLLPGDSEEDPEDLALLEARDLLFARLLQYRAFKDASELFEARLNSAPIRTPRTVGLDPELADLLPDVILGISGEAFAEIATEAMRPRIPPTVAIEHIHAPAVSVRDQVAAMTTQLSAVGSVSFEGLTADCPDLAHVIARFLGLLQLYTERAVEFEQMGPLSELVITWIESEDRVIAVSGEFDDVSEPGSAPRPEEIHA